MMQPVLPDHDWAFGKLGEDHLSVCRFPVLCGALARHNEAFATLERMETVSVYKTDERTGEGERKIQDSPPLGPLFFRHK